MAQPYINPATATRIQGAKQRMFATRKVLGDAAGTLQNITFWRDDNLDGTPVPFGPFEVLVVIPEQRGQTREGDATALTASDGEFQSDDPDFDVQKGDTFKLDSGATGRVVLSPIDTGAFQRAPFELQG